MIKATISGDIIASTTISVDDRLLFLSKLKELFARIENKYNFYGRIIKGDYLECYIDDPRFALRIALIIKNFIKSTSAYALNKSTKNESRGKYFKIYGVRLAIGVGSIERFDKENGIIEGESIQFSGRIIGNESSHNNEKRVVIKQTLFIQTSNTLWNNEFNVTVSLIDFLLTKSTSNQCAIIIEKLLGESEEQIATQLNISQSAVNQRSKSGGWNAIEKAIERFENVVQ